MMRDSLPTRDALDARLDAALAARRAAADLPMRVRAEALARAAARWQRDARLAAALVDTTGFSRPMVRFRMHTLLYMYWVLIPQDRSHLLMHLCSTLQVMR